VDARLIEEVKSCGKSGKIVHSEAEAGGVGALKEIHAVATFNDDDAKN